MTNPGFLLIAFGYLVLLFTAGWVGLIVAALHVTVMGLAIVWKKAMSNKSPPR